MKLFKKTEEDIQRAGKLSQLELNNLKDKKNDL